MRHKVAVIGGGFVGATTAQRIAEAELADVVLVDIMEGIPQGKGLDILEACPITGSSSRIVGTNDMADIVGCQIVVMTAGLPRKPGMTREDLVRDNARIVGGVAEKIKQYAPEAMVIVVTNPLDIMTYLMFKKTGFAANKVFGMAGVLDTARYRTFLSLELGVTPEDISAMVLGGHGDEMVPLVDCTTVSGIPVRQLLSEEVIQQIVERTRKGGGEIVNLLKTGSAYYAPSAAAVQMVKAVLLDQKRLLPCAAYLTSQYGINDAYVGVPVVLGAKGVERIIELQLEPSDLAQLQKSAQIIQDNIGLLGL